MESEAGDITRVSAAQLQAIENQLFSLVRQQAKRNHPIELPRPDFWTQVSVLLTSIDTELAEIGKNEGWSVKAVNLSRRQGNVRRAVADLTQHRLTSFVRHAGHCPVCGGISFTPNYTPDEDEEDRIARMSAYPTSGMLANDLPSNSASESTTTSSEENDEQTQNKDLIRIKILQDLPEPIIDAEGNELELMSGDIEFCDSDYASGLIAAGLAEKASL